MASLNLVLYHIPFQEVLWQEAVKVFSSTRAFEIAVPSLWEMWAGVEKEHSKSVNIQGSHSTLEVQYPEGCGNYFLVSGTEGVWYSRQNLAVKCFFWMKEWKLLDWIRRWDWFLIAKGKYNWLLMRLFNKMWIIHGWKWGQCTVTWERLDEAIGTIAT